MARSMRQRILKYNTPRRIVQLLAFVFFSSIVFGVGTLPLLVPILWTMGLNQNTIGDAFSVIQMQFYGAVFPWLAIAAFLIVGMVIGKSLCGWICPFGFAQDLLGFIKRKKTDFSSRTHDSLVYAKQLVLAITLFISVTFAASKVLGMDTGYESSLGIFVKAPFTSLSPAETLFATLPRMIANFRTALATVPVSDALSGILTLPALFWVQFFIMIFVLVSVAYVPRAWCRYVCPHGAIMAIMNKFSFIGLRRDPVKCTKGGCGACVMVCPMRVPILELPWEKFSHEECIYCLKCVDACDEHAIRVTYP